LNLTRQLRGIVQESRFQGLGISCIAQQPKTNLAALSSQSKRKCIAVQSNSIPQFAPAENVANCSSFCMAESGASTSTPKGSSQNVIASPCQRLTPFGGDPKSRNFDFLPARDDALGALGRESGADKLDHLRHRETMRQHSRLGAAVAAGGEQFERAAIGLGAAAGHWPRQYAMPWLGGAKEGGLDRASLRPPGPIWRAARKEDERARVSPAVVPLVWKSVCFSICAGNAYWCHFSAKSVVVSTNGSLRSES